MGRAGDAIRTWSDMATIFTGSGFWRVGLTKGACCAPNQKTLTELSSANQRCPFSAKGDGLDLRHQRGLRPLRPGRRTPRGGQGATLLTREPFVVKWLGHEHHQY